MTAMLRSRVIPCKLVMGKAGNQQHAWIDVWTDETGWVSGIIRFDGKKWVLMDPTFASGKNDYTGDGTNYSPTHYR
jgi:transglutaminase-like putative cysteine protease